MLVLRIIKKKIQAIDLRQKYIYSYETFYNNKHKGTSNKFAAEIFSFILYISNNKQKGRKKKIELEILSCE